LDRIRHAGPLVPPTEPALLAAGTVGEVSQSRGAASRRLPCPREPACLHGEQARRVPGNQVGQLAVTRRLFLRSGRPSPGRVVVQAVEGGGTVPAEIKLAVRRLLGVFGQLPLEVAAAAFVAGALDVALQLPKSTFVLVHDAKTSSART